jgi:tRNA threonylcarbamoyladenosine biosynthesis protein TsaE
MAQMKWQTGSTSISGTEKIGEELGKLLKAPDVIELRSDLGGGKTTFVRGLARGLGSKDRVTSPTFTLNRIYRAPAVQVHHFDFYRLTEAGIVSDQLEESLNDPRVITIVEWSDIVEGVLPPQRLVIELSPTASDPDERLIQISYPIDKQPIIERLQTNLTEVKP